MEGEHTCNHAGEIGRMQAKLDEVYKTIMGNGRKGLKETVPVLIEQVSDLRIEIKEDRDVMLQLRTAVSGLLQFQQEQEAKAKTRDEERDKDRKKKDRRIMLYMAAIATLSLMLTIFINYA